MTDMQYRRLGRSGLKVSLLSFGSWVTFANADQIETAQQAAECLSAAKDAGVNFFDNAEAYSAGESERVMGDAVPGAGLEAPRVRRLHEALLGTPRRPQHALHPQSQVPHPGHRRLARALRPRLRRPRVLPPTRPEHADRRDRVGHERHDHPGQGPLLGHVGVDADEIRAAYDIADRHHLHKPVMEQPEYNILHRRKVEKEYARLYEDIGLGTTIWSPLASGLLTGKYLNGVPEGSRASLPGYEWLKEILTDEASNKKVAALKVIADELDVSLAQFSLAWCAKNPHVSTVITGASNAAQVRENMTALDVLPLLTPEVMERVDAISNA